MFAIRFLSIAKRLTVPFLLFSGLEFMMLLLTEPEPEGYHCYMHGEAPEGKIKDWTLSTGIVPQRLDDVLDSKVKPISDRSIFFHETRCHPAYSVNTLELSGRQACAIESAALNNPTFQVFVLFTSTTYLPNADKLKQAIINALLSYRNVQFRQLDIWQYAKDTPMENWINREDLFRSSFLKEHISDLLRLLSLYRYGGIYLDLDVMVLRSFEYVPLNFAGLETNTSIGNTVLGLDNSQLGNYFLKNFLQDFEENFAGDLWAENGPRSLSRVIKKICNSNKFSLLLDNPDRCQGFKVYNISAFYEINWLEWFNLFVPSVLNDTLKRVKDSYVIHLWNHLNSFVPLDPKSPYIHLAKRHCPKVLAAAGSTFV
ncbi:hypothetical protein KR222_000556 [Zaprionus bogoriensis]|nr:hypothetical protein KR222_000556 [Zaprionus bogoriensis]